MPLVAVAVYDACVLHGWFLRDFLVRLAVRGHATRQLRARWTGRIHREWIRSVLRRTPAVGRARLERTRAAMDANVFGCRVKGYRRWEQRLSLPDPNDRHVLAAALACVADTIVTFNVRDFPPATLAPFGIRAATPDEFLLTEIARDLVIATAGEHRAALYRPVLTPDEYRDALRRRGLPQTAAALANVPI